MTRIPSFPSKCFYLPLVHSMVHMGDWSSQNGGQALPHSLKTIPSGQSLSTIFILVVLGESLTCGSPVVSMTRKFSSSSTISSSSMEILKHARVTAWDKVKMPKLDV